MGRYPEQWQLYKQIRILNPRNLPDLSHDVSQYPSLSLPTESEGFAAEWQRYCRVEQVFPDSPTDLAAYWSKHNGVLANAAKFLLSVPVASADVEHMPLCHHIAASARVNIF